jgi:hypothetical protein
MNKFAKFVATAAIILVLGTFSVAEIKSPLHHTNTGDRNTNLNTPGQCTYGWLLDGTYGFRVTNGQYIVGTLNFNGNCGVSGVNTYTGQNGGVTDMAVTGTYVVNADGTITISITFGEETTPQYYLIALSRTLPGAVGEGVNGTPGQIQLVAQNNFWFWKYTNASLYGSYAAMCYVNATLNYVTFDGKGNVSGISPYFSNGVEVSDPYTGTYTVNSDGTFTGSLNGSFSQYTFYGSLENGGNQIVYMYDAAGFGIDDSCVGNH